MMLINLLPWRAAQRKKVQQQFIVAIVMVIGLTLTVITALNLELKQRIQIQQQRNILLQQTLKQDTNHTISVDLSQQLQLQRQVIQRLLTKLNKLLPQSVLLIKFELVHHQISIAGSAASALAVSQLVHNIESSIWLSKPKLIEHYRANQFYLFKLKMQLKHANNQA